MFKERVLSAAVREQTVFDQVKIWFTLSFFDVYYKNFDDSEFLYVRVDSDSETQRNIQSGYFGQPAHLIAKAIKEKENNK